MGLLSMWQGKSGRSSLQEIAVFVGFNIAAIIVARSLLQSMDPQREKRLESKNKSKAVLSRLGVRDVQLNDHEQAIAAEVIHPDDIKVKFQDVGGLDQIIEQLREAIIYPLVYPQLFESVAGLYAAPKGVLLYGPPGCGKTLLAQAMAKESGATFINIKASVLQDKWYGESQKLVAALFSLAKKLQPSIIFIDELDAFMRERSRSDHEISGMVKAEFMSSWDGLTSGGDKIMVLGATNRPNDIDQAILRRMPSRFAIKLPDPAQRKSILSLMLRDIQVEPNFDIDTLVRRTDGLSGSDLKEVCRAAALVPVREVLRAKKGDPIDLEKAKREGFTIRSLRQSDFLREDYSGLQSAKKGLHHSSTGFIDMEEADVRRRQVGSSRLQ